MATNQESETNYEKLKNVQPNPDAENQEEGEGLKTKDQSQENLANYENDGYKRLDGREDQENQMPAAYDPHHQSSSEKIGSFGTFFAIVKGYCALIFLVLPKGFSNGGWAFSSFCIAMSGLISIHCTLKLIGMGSHLKCYDYSGIVGEALGARGRRALDFILFCVQTSFCISYVTFIYQAVVNICFVLFGITLTKVEVGLLCAVVFSCLAMVKSVEAFSFAYVLGTFLMLAGTAIIVVFCLEHVFSEEWLVQGFVALNRNDFYNMIGFSIYSFEGIGIIMPVMNSCAVPEKFPFLFVISMIFLIVIYILVGGLGYYAYGDTMDKQFIFEMFNQSNPIIFLIQLLFVVNLFCSFPLTSYPIFTILEDYAFTGVRTGSLKQWVVKVSRYSLYLTGFRIVFIICFVYVALELADKLDKFLSLLGALFCAPLVITIPCLCNAYMFPDQSKWKQIEDWLWVIISLIMIVFCTTITTYGWNA